MGVWARVAAAGLLAVGLLETAGCGRPPAPTAAAEVAARMQGEWRIALTAEQRQQLDLMRFVLRQPPPSNDELEGLSLTEDQTAAAIVILNEIRYDPDGPRTEQLRAAVASLESGELSIGPGRLELRLGTVRKSGTYTITSASGSQAQLTLTESSGAEETVHVALTDEGDLLFGEAPDAVTFVRR